MRTLRFIASAALLVTTAFATSGPPWISIEYPANPYDSASRDALLLVHAFHHGTPVGFPVSGTAEGLVGGTRKTVSLEFKTTTRPGVYALNKQWGDAGVWTLIIGATQGRGEGNTAYAIVELGANGKVSSVDVPTKQQGQWKVPAAVVMKEIEEGLAARAKLASR